MKRLLVLLLIILKEADPTAACSYDYWEGTCYCSSRGLSSVPQNLPWNTMHLYLSNNHITTISQSDFYRYRSLVELYLRNNQIYTINSGAFCNLTRLTYLHINNNQLTILRADMFVGLDSLQQLYLYYNNISTIVAEAFVNLPRLEHLSLHDNQITSLPSDVFVGLDSLVVLYLHHNNISTIAAGTFVNLQKLERLYLSHNRISTFPSDPLSYLKNALSTVLTLNDNQIETLPYMAYDILASIKTVDISNNPWQCDCRMYPFKQRMTGLPKFESQIQCAASVLEDKSLLHDVTPEDLICEGPLGAFFLSGSLGVVVGIFVNMIFSHVIWPRCKNRERKTSPATTPTPIPAPDTHTDIDGAQAGRDVTETGAAESDDVERAHDPVLYDLDLGYRLVRPSLPPITGTGVD